MVIRMDQCWGCLMDGSMEKMSADSKVLSLDHPRGEMMGLYLDHLMGRTRVEDLDQVRVHQLERLRPWECNSGYCLVMQ